MNNKKLPITLSSKEEKMIDFIVKIACEYSNITMEQFMDVKIRHKQSYSCRQLVGNYLCNIKNMCGNHVCLYIGFDYERLLTKSFLKRYKSRYEKEPTFRRYADTFNHIIVPLKTIEHNV